MSFFFLSVVYDVIIPYPIGQGITFAFSEAKGIDEKFIALGICTPLPTCSLLNTTVLRKSTEHI